MLKPRLIDPVYMWKAKTDFLLLEQKQEDYSAIFSNHPIYPAENYHRELSRIKEEWKNRSNPGGGRSEDGDIQQLYIAYDQVRLQQITFLSILNQMFAQVYGYFNDMLSDNSIGYLSDEDFNDYLIQYLKAIETNKRLGLECWNTDIALTIEKKVAAFNPSGKTLQEVLAKLKR